jgi:prepilin-type N-terminal cleavage/methylation domain-containing protein
MRPLRSVAHSAARRIRRVSTGGDRGITLTELIIAMALSSILGTMTLLVFLGLNTASTTTVERSLSASEARVILSSWSSLLQVAESPSRNAAAQPAFARATATELCFYASLDNRSPASGAANFGAPTPVRLFQEGESVVEERFTPSYSDDCESTPAIRRVLADRATVGFDVLDKTGAAISPGDSAEDLQDVATVSIRLTVTDDTGEVHVYDAAAGGAS